MKIITLPLLLLAFGAVHALASSLGYPIVGTGQTQCYDADHAIPAPQPGQTYYGQDAQHPGNAPAYRDNGDGTITDLVSGLTWVQARGQKVSWDDAMAGARTCRVAGHDDWRAPTIKELYSLINFTGHSHGISTGKPYLDTHFFQFVFGDPARGERLIDCQDWSATRTSAPP
ncbi:MAG: DUF1566 domain-containing protein [Chthoniobacteraceae bacterium]